MLLYDNNFLSFNAKWYSNKLISKKKYLKIYFHFLRTISQESSFLSNFKEEDILIFLNFHNIFHR